MKLIGLAGHIGAGKNLAASMIPGAFVLEWSDRLYAGLSAVLGVPVSLLKARRTKEHGLEIAGMRLDVRRCLQTLGTEWGRDSIHGDLWVRLTMESVAMLAATETATVFAIPGTRFPNEADAIRERGGELWWIDRPGLAPTDHVSDHMLTADSCDRVIANAGTVDDLRNAVASAWASFTKELAEVDA